MKTKASSAAERMKRLREKYVNQLPGQIGQIADLLDAMEETGPAAEALEELHRRVHTLKGASASFGFLALSTAAAAGEVAARRAMHGDAAPDAAWMREMRDRIYSMLREAEFIDPAAESGQEPLEMAVAAEIHRDRDHKLVYVCDDDLYQCQNLKAQISCYGFQVVAFENLVAFLEAMGKTPPDAVVMDMIHADRRTGGAETVQEALEGREHPPVIFLSSSAELTSRLAAVRAGASAYFVKPPNIPDLCSTLHTLTATDVPEPYLILIIEDEPHLAEMYAATLQQAGMETRVLNDPLEAFPLLFELRPDLILMDMHMPGCNGMDLAKAIRQLEAYISVPIVFLSGETDVDLHFQARRMGGDEFLIKPIKPEHLISAVSVRAERMKLIRSLMVRDAMTGLLNHSAVKEALQKHIERARRSGEDICFAMIDLDHFKKVNDCYGHPVGDQVLVALAGLLKQRLRKSDVVGRYGGEEFAVILPDCSWEKAAALLNELRESFAGISFRAGDEAFSATFSCGVASQVEGVSMEELCAAADKALYEAKGNGRNRVELGAACAC